MNCTLNYKGREFTADQFAEYLHSGHLDELIVNGEVSTEKLVVPIGKTDMPMDVYTNSAKLVDEEKARGAEDVEAIKTGLKQVQRSDWYKGLDEAKQKEVDGDYLSGAEKFFQAEIKRKKAVKDTSPKVITTEKKGLIKQIKDVARGAKEGAKATKLSIKETIKTGLEKLGGKLSPAQTRSIVNKATSTNFDSASSVQKLEDHIDKVVSNVNYAERLNTARDAQKSAKKKTHGRFTSIAKEFLSIDPSELSPESLDKYEVAVSDMNQKVPSYTKMKEIFDDVMAEANKEEFESNKIDTFEKLSNKAKEVFENKVTNLDEYKKLSRDVASLKRTLKKLLANDTITQEEFDAEMETIGGKEAKLEEAFKDEIDALKSDMIKAVRGIAVDKSSLTQPERDILDHFDSLTDEDLKLLTPGELDLLHDVLTRTAEGYLKVDKINDIINAVESKKFAPKIVEQIDSSKKKEQSTEDVIRKLNQNEATFISYLTGIKQGGAVDKYFVQPIIRALSAMNRAQNDAREAYFKAKERTFKDRLTNNRDFKKSSHKLGMIYNILQNHSGDAPADWIIMSGNDAEVKKYIDSLPEESRKSVEASIQRQKDLFKKGGLAGKFNVGFNKAEALAEAYKELQRKYPNPDGTLNTEAIYNDALASPENIMNERELKLFEAINKISDELSDKQQAVNESKGLEYKKVPFHTFRSPIRIEKESEMPMSSGKPKMTAGSSKSRTQKVPVAIETDVEKLIMKSINDTNQDYYGSMAIKALNTMASEVAKKGQFSNNVFSVIRDNVNSRIRLEFEKQDRSTKIGSLLLTARMARSLFDPIRAVAETSSAFLSTPLRTGNLQGWGSFVSSKDRKLFEMLAKDTNSSLGLKTVNRTLESGTEVNKKFFLNRAYEKIVTLPEHLTISMAWAPVFKESFEDITGEQFNQDEYVNNPEYRKAFKQDILDAATEADVKTKNIVGGGLKFEGREKIPVFPFTNGVNSKGLTGRIAGFFSTYTARESRELWHGIRNFTEDKGAMKSMGVIVSAMTYSVMAGAYYALWQKMFGDDEEKKKGKQTMERYFTFDGIKQEFKNNLLYLHTSRYGAVGRALTTLAANGMYNTADTKEEKQQIATWMENTLFSKPIDFSKEYGNKDKVASAMAMLIPQVSIAVDLITKNGGNITKLYKKIKEDGLESLTQDEKDQYVLWETALQALNVALIFKGTQVPMTPKLEYYLREKKKQAEPEKKGYGHQKPTKPKRIQ